MYYGTWYSQWQGTQVHVNSIYVEKTLKQRELITALH